MQEGKCEKCELVNLCSGEVWEVWASKPMQGEVREVWASKLIIPMQGELWEVWVVNWLKEGFYIPITRGTRGSRDNSLQWWEPINAIYLNF